MKRSDDDAGAKVNVGVFVERSPACSCALPLRGPSAQCPQLPRLAPPRYSIWAAIGPNSGARAKHQWKARTKLTKLPL